MPVLGNYAYTKNLYDFSLSVASLMQRDRDGLLVNLGSTQGIRKAEFCTIVNDLHHARLMEWPILLEKATTLSLTAGTLNYPIPDDLLGGDIVNIEVVDSPYEGVNLQRLDYVAPYWYRLQPSCDRDPSQPGLVSYPTWWTYNEDRTEIIFRNFWQSSFDVGISYRYAPSTFVAADYDDQASAKRFGIPDVYLTNSLGKEVARELFNRAGSTERAAQMTAALEGDAGTLNMITDQLAQTIANIPYAILRHDFVRSTGGMPPNYGGAMRRVPMRRTNRVG